MTDYRIVESLGATEGAPAAGGAELIVDITTTGATLQANALKVLDDGVMLRSEANPRGLAQGRLEREPPPHRPRHPGPHRRRGAGAQPRAELRAVFPEVVPALEAGALEPFGASVVGAGGGAAGAALSRRRKCPTSPTG